MKTRSNEPELLDDLQLDPDALLHSLNFMKQVNELFGGHRVILDYFGRQELPQKFSVLDIGCGGGDVPFALAKWAKARGLEVEITAIDIQPLCLAYATEHHSLPNILYLSHSAFDIERLGKFDYVMSSMFFHHLTDPEIVQLLKLVHSVARRGWIVNDLYRGALNYAGAWLLGLASGKVIVFNDAKLSVARAFRPADLERYGREASLPDVLVRRRPVFRLAMNGHGTD